MVMVFVLLYSVLQFGLKSQKKSLGSFHNSISSESFKNCLTKYDMHVIFMSQEIYLL